MAILPMRRRTHHQVTFVEGLVEPNRLRERIRILQVPGRPVGFPLVVQEFSSRDDARSLGISRGRSQATDGIVDNPYID